MNKIRVCTLLTALALLVVLAGCGNKGDLVRPAPKADAPASS
jgi:predicted small lipoprotein YifL